MRLRIAPTPPKSREIADAPAPPAKYRKTFREILVWSGRQPDTCVPVPVCGTVRKCVQKGSRYTVRGYTQARGHPQSRRRRLYLLVEARVWKRASPVPWARHRCEAKSREVRRQVAKEGASPKAEESLLRHMRMGHPCNMLSTMTARAWECLPCQSVSAAAGRCVHQSAS